MKKNIVSMCMVALAAITFISCENVPSPYNNPNGNKGETNEGIYLNETFSSNLGKFTTVTPKGIAWQHNFGTATATGYNAKDKTNTESESYLVSPIIDLAKAKQAYLQFEYIIRYLSHNGANKVLITKKYTGNPTTTVWEDITGTLKEGSNWTDFTTYAKNLDAKYIGDTLRIAFYYSSTTTGSRTWEIKNVVVKEGTVNEEGGGGEQEKPEGNGTEAAPYNVAAAIAKATASNVFVKGYIVGYVYGMKYDGARFSSDTCTVNGNVLIANSPNQIDKSKCMPVQLPAGAIRDLLNLKDHKANLKQEVLLFGQIDTYFGVPGLKFATYAKLGSTEAGTKPGGLFYENFASGKGAFTIVDESALPTGLTQIWAYDSKGHYMKASAYMKDAKHATESWLISPVIDLSKVTSATLTFEQAGKFFGTTTIANEITVEISTDYNSGKPSTTTWTKATMSALPTNKNFTFVATTIDLTPYAGNSHVRIGFRYTSNITNVGTWEVKNISIK